MSEGGRAETSLGQVWEIGSDRDCKVLIDESFSSLILGNGIQGPLRMEGGW